MRARMKEHYAEETQLPIGMRKQTAISCYTIYDTFVRSLWTFCNTSAPRYLYVCNSPLLGGITIQHLSKLATGSSAVQSHVCQSERAAWKQTQLPIGMRKQSEINCHTIYDTFARNLWAEQPFCTPIVCVCVHVTSNSPQHNKKKQRRANWQLALQGCSASETTRVVWSRQFEIVLISKKRRAMLLWHAVRLFAND